MAQIIGIELVELNLLLLTLINHIHVNHTLIWIQLELNNSSILSICEDCPVSTICFLSVWQFSSKRDYVTVSSKVSLVFTDFPHDGDILSHQQGKNPVNTHTNAIGPFLARWFPENFIACADVNALNHESV